MKNKQREKLIEMFGIKGLGYGQWSNGFLEGLDLARVKILEMLTKGRNKKGIPTVNHLNTIDKISLRGQRQ